MKRGRKPVPGLEALTMQTRKLANDILDKYSGVVERIEICALLGFTPGYLTKLADGKRNAAPDARSRMQRLLDDPEGLLKEWTRNMHRKLLENGHRNLAVHS